MKLLVVLSIKEYQERVASLLHNAGIDRFSVTDIAGYKKTEETLSWFGTNSAKAKINSILLFSFISKECAEKAIAEIESCNIDTDNPFPVHAFMLDVEQFSKMI